MAKKPSDRQPSEPKPIIATRVSRDLKKVLRALDRLTEGKFEEASFVREAIAEKLEREYDMELLKKLGYIPDLKRKS